MNPERRWLTISQAADFLQINLKTCYSMAARGELPSVRLGKRSLRIDGRVLEADLERQVAGRKAK